MRILILSDLHLEFGGLQPADVCHACGERYRRGEWTDGSTWHQGRCDICGTDETGVTAPDACGYLCGDWDLALPDADRYDMVILAGDIHSHTHAIPWAARTFSKPVIYVPGNHEFYGAHYQGLWAELRRCAAGHGHVHLLDNEAVEIDGVRVYGAVLWTDFMLHGSDTGTIGRCMSEAKRGMPDFSCIRFSGGSSLSPADTARLHRESTRFLAEALDTPFNGPTIVVTHHLPSAYSVADRFKQDLMSAAFASHLDRVVARAELWVHGHTHDSFDYEIGKCRVVCNPRGYPNSRMNRYENPAFDPAKIIEIGASSRKVRGRS
jgi:predicted phosphodiesterase